MDEPHFLEEGNLGARIHQSQVLAKLGMTIMGTCGFILDCLLSTNLCFTSHFHHYSGNSRASAVFSAVIVGMNEDGWRTGIIK